MPLNVSAGASPVSMPVRMVLLTGLTLVAVGCAGEANVTESKSPATVVATAIGITKVTSSRSQESLAL